MVRTLQETLRAGRIAAVGHARAAELAGFPWKEETVTDILLATTGQRLTATVFNRGEEFVTGADWYWWWVDSTGRAFGTLIQAKRLWISSVRKNWRFDFNYNGGTQRASLIATAEALGVPPVYMLYLGTPEFRRPFPCGSDHKKTGYCVTCNAYGTALYPALHSTHAPIVDAESTYEQAQPLEWLPNPTKSDGRWFAGMTLTDDLLEFLQEPQVGARGIAKLLLEKLGRQARLGQFGPSGVVLETYERIPPPFDVLPEDRGHWNTAYFPHILQGLKPTLPADVMAAVESREVQSLDLPDALAVNIAGIVITHMGEG